MGLSLFLPIASPVMFDICDVTLWTNILQGKIAPYILTFQAYHLRNPQPCHHECTVHLNEGCLGYIKGA